jgi:hypothetical protein
LAKWKAEVARTSLGQRSRKTEGISKSGEAYFRTSAVIKTDVRRAPVEVVKMREEAA